MSDKIAIDVALLLPKEVVQIVTSINEKLVTSRNSPIRFGRGGSFPHISLVMAIANLSEIDQINNRLVAIARRSTRLDLQVLSFTDDERLPTGEQVSSFVIERTEEILELQKDVIRGITDLLSHELLPAMLFRPDEVSNSTFAWMKEYVEGFLRIKNFNPHVTLGIGSVRPNTNLPLAFIASELAVCHMGNNCTCNTVLGSHTLRDH